MIGVVLLLGLGLILIVAEVLIPSMGVLGTCASLCIVGSIFWAFWGFGSGFGWQILFAATLLVPVVIMTGFKLLPKSPLAKKIIAGGFTFEDGEGTDDRDKDLLGKEGIVEAPLRPAGTARLEGRRVDVMSRGSMIESGARVRVIEVQGNRVVVARVEEESAASEPA